MTARGTRLASVPDASASPPASRARRGKPKPKSITQAASDGDNRALLIGMRARVATAVEDPNTPARDLAALTRRLMEITKDIEALDARGREDAPGAVTPDESFDSSAL